MKKIITVLFIAAIITSATFAQAPQGLSYQAIVRDASTALVTSTAIGMRISILQGTPTGTAVYTETHTPTTNANGLVSIEIGAGTTGDNFSLINWNNGPYFLKTETDPTGGTTYTISGTTQLLSVPYALYANTFSGDMNNQPITNVTDPTNAQDAATKAYVDDLVVQTASVAKLMQVGFTVQELLNSGRTVKEFVDDNVTVDSLYGRTYQGGLIFYVNTTDGSGMVAANTYSQEDWGCNGTDLAGASGTAVGTGAQNTIDIDAACTTTNIAADYCINLTSGGHNDWFLPSIDELNLMYTNLKANGYGGFYDSHYWSSSENSTNYAQAIDFSSGSIITMSAKGNSSYVRAARAF